MASTIRRVTPGAGPKDLVTLRVLGRLELIVEGIWTSLPVASQRLLALLAVRRRDMGRAAVASTLWPDHDPEHASANLRTALWRVRAAAPSAIDAHGDSIGIDAGVRVDLRDAEDLAHRIIGGEASVDDALAERGLLVQDLLPESDDDWLAFERERFREVRVRALERLCDLASESGRHAEAVEAGLLAVDAEPLRESAHRALMRAFLAEGNGALAVQQARNLESALRRELDVDPSRATIDLTRYAATHARSPEKVREGGAA